MRPDELPRIAHDPATFETFYREHVEAVQRFVRAGSTIRSSRPT